MRGGAAGQAGYYYQNLVAARHLLDLIALGSRTEWVALENPEAAPHIDDVIVGERGLTRYTQVKWSDDESASLTLTGLVAEGDSGDSLLRKLATGFAAASSAADRPVSVALLSTWRPGTQKRQSEGWDKSLKQFIAEFHEPFVARDDWQLVSDHERYIEYANVLGKLQEAAGLGDDPESFSIFLKALCFELERPSREVLRNELGGRLLGLGIDSNRMPVLLDAAVRWSIEGRTLRSEDVLLELGLQTPFSDTLVQHYPVDEEGWVDRPEFFEALDSALEAVDGGYILVEGEAGIGKSTAITRYLARRDDIAFTYYCFVPDDHTLGNERLTQDAFLRSLCAGLGRAFPEVQLPRPYAPPSLRLLNDWLQALAESDQRVVLVIDGVDHVARKADEGLLRDPLTPVLDGVPPSGVTLVVTSRLSSALPASVRDIVETDAGRHIRLAPLTTEQVRLFFWQRGVMLSDDDLDLAVRVSAGLPVYLEVLAQQLEGVPPYEHGDTLARSTVLGDEGIDRFHRDLWSQIESDTVKCWLLAILGRRSEFTSAETLHAMLAHLGVQADRPSVNAALAELRPVLRLVDGGDVALLHSSLEEYVAVRTTEMGVPIAEALLAHYESEPDTDEAWRNSFRHLVELGQQPRVLELCSSVWFERAWRSHRPFKEIRLNTSIAMECAEQLGRLDEFVRLTLLSQQVALLEGNLDLSPSEEASLLLDLGEPAMALRRLWSGQHRLCGVADFARFCNRFEDTQGQPLPGRIVKQCLGESSPSGSSVADNCEFYAALSSATPADQLVAEIESTTWTAGDDGRRRGELDDRESDSLVQTVLRAVVQRAADRKDPSALWSIVNGDASATARSIASAGLAILFADSGEVVDARAALRDVDTTRLDRDSLRWVSLSLARLSITEDLPAFPDPHPKLPRSLLAASYGINDELVDLLAELQWAFLAGDHTMPAWVEAEATGLPRRLGEVVNVLAQVATLWRRHVEGDPEPEVSRLIRESILAMERAAMRSASSERSQAEIFRTEVHYLISQIWRCAEVVLDAHAFEELTTWWASTESASRYPAVTAEIVRSLLSGHRGDAGNGEGALNSTIRHLLTVLEKDARADEDSGVMTPKLTTCAALAGLAGLTATADRIWRDLLDAGRGVYWRKDYQFNEVLTPLRHAHQIEPDRTIDRIRDQLQLVYRLEPAARSRTSAVAAQELIAFTGEVDSGLALRSLVMLEDLVWRSEALHQLARSLGGVGYERRLVAALVGTMARWSDHRDFNDHLYPALIELVGQALAEDDLEEAERLCRGWQPVLLVEKAAPGLASDLLQLWSDHGFEPPEDLLAELSSADTDAKSAQAGQDRWRAEGSEAIRARLEEAEPNPASISGIVEQLEREEAERSLRQRLQRSMPELEAALAAVGVATSDARGFCQHLANDLEQHLVVSGEADVPSVLDLVAQNLALLNAPPAEPIAIGDVEVELDLVGWIEDLLSGLGSAYPVENAVKDRLGEWIAASPIQGLGDWEEFVRSRSHDVASAGLLAIAGRLATIDPRRAESLLADVVDEHAHSLLYDRHGIRSVALVARQLSPALAKTTLMRVFRKHHERYPGMGIYNLSDLLEELAPLGEHPALAIYEHFAEHNRVLTAGLSPAAPDLAWFAPSVEANPEREVLRYLLDLFDYPVVDIRLLAASELFELLCERGHLIGDLLDLWHGGSTGCQEFCATVLTAVNTVRTLDSDHVERVIQLAVSTRHHNIRAAVLHLAEARDTSGGPSPAAKELVTRPGILRPRQDAAIGTGVWLPPYLAWFTDMVTQLTDTEFGGLVMHHLRDLDRDFSRGREREMAIHRRYNINSNFDTIEIAGPYDRAARQAVNEALRAAVEAWEIEPSLAIELGRHLRVFDPSDLSQRPTPPPVEVWADVETTEDEFLAFSDLGGHLDRLVSLDNDWSTVFEHTELRSKEEVAGATNRVTKVRIHTFLWPSGTPAPSESEVASEVATGALCGLPVLNRAELANADPPAGSAGILPLAVRSVRDLRGRYRTDLAALNQGFAPDLLPIDGEDPFARAESGEPVVRSREWQGPFDQDRRRHEPRSAGFILEAKRQWLAERCDALGRSLWAYVVLARTTDRYRPEAAMEWSTQTALVQFGPLGDTDGASTDR